MVQRLCGGLQGIIVCEATFEPGVEAYLAMGTQWCKSYNNILQWLLNGAT